MSTILQNLIQIGILKEIRLKSINKETLANKKLPKGDLKGAATTLLRAFSSANKKELVFLLPSVQVTVGGFLVSIDFFFSLLLLL